MDHRRRNPTKKTHRSKKIHNSSRPNPKTHTRRNQLKCQRLGIPSDQTTNNALPLPNELPSVEETLKELAGALKAAQRTRTKQSRSPTITSHSNHRQNLQRNPRRLHQLQRNRSQTKRNGGKICDASRKKPRTMRPNQILPQWQNLQHRTY